MAVVGNLKKARKRWERMYMILGQEGADPRTSENFYKAVVQVTLLFGAGSWVMYPWIGRILFGFHRRVAFRMDKDCWGGHVDLSTSESGYEGRGDVGGGDVHPPPPQ